MINVDVAAATGFLGLMPALTPDGLGLKAVTFYPSNAERGIPTPAYFQTVLKSFTLARELKGYRIYRRRSTFP